MEELERFFQIHSDWKFYDIVFKNLRFYFYKEKIKLKKKLKSKIKEKNC